MDYAIAHKTVPARVVIDFDGEDYEVATFDVRLPIHARLGEQGVNEDGERYVSVAPYLDPDAVDKALSKLVKRRALAS